LSVDPEHRRRPSAVVGRWNRYLYAQGNPVLRRDPDGEQDELPFFVPDLLAELPPPSETSVVRLGLAKSRLVGLLPVEAGESLLIERSDEGGVSDLGAELKAAAGSPVLQPIQSSEDGLLIALGVVQAGIEGGAIDDGVEVQAEAQLFDDAGSLAARLSAETSVTISFREALNAFFRAINELNAHLRGGGSLPTSRDEGRE